MKDTESQFEPEKVEVFEATNANASYFLDTLPRVPLSRKSDYDRLLEMYRAKCEELDTLAESGCKGM